MRVFGYLRVSTADQEYGIDAQREAIRPEAERRGWEVEWFEKAGKSGKSIDRPGIVAVLAQLRSGNVDSQVVSKLDRLSRSVPDFARRLEVSVSRDRRSSRSISTSTPRRRPGSWSRASWRASRIGNAK